MLMAAIKTNILFGPDHKLFRANLLKFINARINPFVDEWEQNKQFPVKKLFKELGNLGIFGVNKPKEFGGLDLDFTYSVAMAETMGHINCGGIPMAVAVQSDMATPSLSKFGSYRLKTEFLKPSISGDRVACIGISEPNAGSDVARIKTTARRRNGDLVINGSKLWITNGHHADWICLLANSNTSQSIHKNKSLICVSLDEPGIKRGQRIEKLGMHCSDTAELFFDDVVVPAANIIGEEGRGFVYQMEQFENERIVAAAVLIRPLEKILVETAKYVHQREMFGRREWENQIVQFKLAELSTELTSLQSLLYQATQAKVDGSEEKNVLASMVKLKGGRLARKITDECLQFWGGMGYTWQNPISRFYRDLRLSSIGGGCDEVMLTIIANWIDKETSAAAAGLPAASYT